VQFALAQVLTSRSRVWVVAYVVASGALLGWFAHMVIAASWVP
jgi:hypothetical protein